MKTMKTPIDYNYVCEAVDAGTHDNGFFARIFFKDKEYTTQGQGTEERGRQNRRATLIRKIMRNYEAI